MKTNYKFLLILLVGFSISEDAFAQRKKRTVKTKPDDKEIKVTDYEETNKKIDEEYVAENKIINIKTHPISFIFGRQFLEAEVKLTDLMSFQLGYGLTFKQMVEEENDVYKLMFSERYTYESPNFNTNNDVFDSYSEYRTQKRGFIISASPRFNTNETFNGIFVSPTFTYIKYNFDAAGIREGFSDEVRDQSVIDKESITFKEISLRAGSQSFRLFGISVEYFVGLGLRLTSNSRQDLGYEKGILVRKFQKFNSPLDILYEGGIRFGFLL